MIAICGLGACQDPDKVIEVSVLGLSSDVHSLRVDARHFPNYTVIAEELIPVFTGQLDKFAIRLPHGADGGLLIDLEARFALDGCTISTGQLRLSTVPSGFIRADITLVPVSLKVNQLSPGQGPTTGGTEIDVSGQGFTRDMRVRVDGENLMGPEHSWVSPCSMHAISPARPGKLGGVPVTVEANGAQVTSPKMFTYYPGQLHFKQRTDSPVVTGQGSTMVVMGDLDGDNIRDLVVANKDAGTVSVLWGKGDGTFTDRKDFHADHPPNGVAIGDFDGDGAPDIVFTKEDADSATVIFNNRHRTFQDPTDIRIGQQVSLVGISKVSYPYRTSQLVDRTPDLVVIAGGALSVSQGSHAPRSSSGRRIDFSPPQPLDLPVPITIEAGSVVFVDLDSPPPGFNEALPFSEVAILDREHEQVYLLRALENYDVAWWSFLQLGKFRTLPSPGALALGDINGDHILDLIIAHKDSNNTVSAFLNTDGNGGLISQPSQIVFTDNAFSSSIATGDVDADGRSDIVVLHETENGATVWKNTSW